MNSTFRKHKNRKKTLSKLILVPRDLKVSQEIMGSQEISGELKRSQRISKGISRDSQEVSRDLMESLIYHQSVKCPNYEYLQKCQEYKSSTSIRTYFGGIFLC